MKPTAPARTAIRGDLLDFVDVPARADASSPAVRFRADHWLLIEDGVIAGATADAPDAGWQRVDHAGKLILPGFIDTHVHSAQLDVIGSWGAQLLDWLETYTFPAEMRQADAAQAAMTAALFLDALLAHGSTSAVVFPTVHKVSVDALFEAAEVRGMRLVAGKVLMDRHAPEGLRDDVEQAQRECLELIDRWHGRGRLAYAVTPRFAPTSSDAQLAMAGELLQAREGLYMQTHVAENPAEVRWVAELFPEARSYLDVYARHGLLNERAVLAHGIWLDDSDRALLRERGAHIAFCPSSNLFLGSGLFGWAAAEEAGVGISLASDVGGGTGLSMQRTLADAYKVQAMAGTKLSAWALLHAATRGAARALHLGHEIGALESGATADVCIWDWAGSAVARQRQKMARDLHEKVFAWIMLGDERDLVESWVAGVCRHRRRATH